MNRLHYLHVGGEYFSNSFVHLPNISLCIHFKHVIRIRYRTRSSTNRDRFKKSYDFSFFHLCPVLSCPGPWSCPSPYPVFLVLSPSPQLFPCGLPLVPVLSYLSGLEMCAARSELYIPFIPGSWLLCTVSTTNTDAFFCPEYKMVLKKLLSPLSSIFFKIIFFCTS